jgi:hypothetical protein
MILQSSSRSVGNRLHALVMSATGTGGRYLDQVSLPQCQRGALI